MAYLNGTVQLQEPHLSQVDALSNSVLKKGPMKHLSAADAERVAEAFRIAYIVLWGKTTLRSLEVSINRARGVAAVLGELKADASVVVAGILQDALEQLKKEDPVQAEEIIKTHFLETFGDLSCTLCEKYNRLPKFMARKAEYSPIASENLIQMLVATAEDYRALYIRLADRLHTLRVLRSLPLHATDRRKIAQEALNVYAPLAHKMGVMKVKGELEDLAFKVLSPDEFKQTKYTQIAANKAYHDAAELIQNLISTDPYLSTCKAQFRLTYRIKDKYQLNLKMRRKGLHSLSEVRDALGLRIIVDALPVKGESTEAHSRRGEHICYFLVSRLRQLRGWAPAEHGFKDYILNKKENGYQSLHQYIKNVALGTNVEVQVRTRAMHQKAELGEAAHWFYKDLLYREEVAHSKLYKVAWRSPEQARAASAAELIGLAKQQLLKNRVFVFLDDKATVLNLKKGSTALDAAFAIHTDVGLSTASATVDGRPCRLDRQLQNGETVSVTRVGQVVGSGASKGWLDAGGGLADLSASSSSSSSSLSSSSAEAEEEQEVGGFQAGATAAATGPRPHWLGMVKTRLAQSTLRAYFRERERSQLAVLGTVQLLMALTLCSEALGRHSPAGKELPDVRTLERWAQERLGGSDLVSALITLGEAPKAQAQVLLSRLLGLTLEETTSSSLRWSLTWARVQGRNGWEDKAMRSSVLLPLLREVLVARGVTDAEARWLDLVGRRSLSDETSPYYSALARHLKAAKGAPITVSVPVPTALASASASDDSSSSSSSSSSEAEAEEEAEVEAGAAKRGASPSNGSFGFLPVGRSRDRMARENTGGGVNWGWGARPAAANPSKPYSLESSALPQSLLARERKKYARKVSLRETFGSLAEKEQDDL